MEGADLKKVLAGFGLATLLAGVAVSGCTGSGKSSWSGSKAGAGGTGEQQQQQQSSWGGSKAGAGGAGSAWGGTKK